MAEEKIAMSERYRRMLEARKPLKKVFGKLELAATPIFENPLSYKLEDILELEDQHYRITYHREGDLEQLGMETQLPGLLYYGALLMGLRGSYHRMVGTATLERFENGEVVETVTNPALWELMYFGKDRPRP